MTGVTARPRPDWVLWTQIPVVKAWEVVALSLDIDPKAVIRVDLKAATAAQALRDDKIGRMAKVWLLCWSGPTSRFNESQHFADRLEVATRNAASAPGAGGDSENSADRLVDLAAVATMAISMGWQIPREFAALAKPVKPDSMLVNIQKAYDLLRKKQGSEPSQRDVSEKVPCARATVSSRWSRVNKW
jgi:hypothetical protein